MWLVIVCGSPLASGQIEQQSADPLTESAVVSVEIDRRLQEHWSAQNIVPAAVAAEHQLLRRVTLDLLGRIPTSSEYEAATKAKDDFDTRYASCVTRLMQDPEYALYQGELLSDILHNGRPGSGEFVDYLRRRVLDGASWDAVFREVLVGPWESPESQPASTYLATRAKDLDRLTTDVARGFFGVDVSCARCHDHPLVSDWKQDHYYGMASFLNRTNVGNGRVGETQTGDVSYSGPDGEKQAAVMFLNGRIFTEPSPEVMKATGHSRRALLVQAALEDRALLSRAIVNRYWRHFFGQGLVEPVDQLHSGNPPSIPGLLEWLADDFATNQYDLRRLVRGIVNTRTYRLDSRLPDDATTSAVSHSAGAHSAGAHFAAALVRPLSPRQYAMSLLTAVGRIEPAKPDPVRARAENLMGAPETSRVEQILRAEQLAAEITAHLDPAFDRQSSASEALFLSNAPEIQRLVNAESGTLTQRLAEHPEPEQIVDAAMKAILGRPPADDERQDLVEWLSMQDSERSRSVEQLVWVLLTCAEFRYQH